MLLAWFKKGEAAVSKKSFWGESIRVWRAFYAFRKADLVVMEGKQNSVRYINVFEKSISPFMNDLDNNNAIFQQDNATIYTSKFTKDWFVQKIRSFGLAN